VAQKSWDDAAKTVEALSKELNSYNWSQARVVCSELVGNIDTAAEPYPEKPARQILNMLRRKRRFDLMELRTCLAGFSG
jgi:hypothetical protein